MSVCLCAFGVLMACVSARARVSVCLCAFGVLMACVSARVCLCVCVRLVCLWRV